ncbi:hypothetical protein BGW38_004088 [Lunasporangiospora selenospora]|uniref:General transcription factor TFIIB n=1 Tax=Lunasporangiospora selenospora TaxID=979761 RepID=A0A9P6G2B5_9FUNG|nr:hypothetical protein BGW38_004088 [Lunasporangiospora selenospora]
MPTSPIQDHSQHANIRDDGDSNSLKMPKSQGSSSRLRCPECHSHNVHHDDSIGSIICHNCGVVIAENQEHEVHEDSSSVFVPSYGTTWVNAVGRANDGRSFAFKGQSRELFQQGPTQKRRHRGKRLSVIKEYLQQISLGTESSAADVKRALYLWGIVMEKTQRRIDRVAEDWALACLYFVAKETKKAISLVQIAISSGRAPNVIGIKYRQLKIILLEGGSIRREHVCFSADEDPWIVLDRIMTIGSEESLQQGRFDFLPYNLKDVLGIGVTDLTMRRSCLRSLLVSAQKCMIVALDSTLLTGRYTNPLAAACLVISIEVKLQLEKCPEELFELAATEFFSTTDTVRSRYHELRKFAPDEPAVSFTVASLNRAKRGDPQDDATLSKSKHVDDSTHLHPPSFQANRAQDERLLQHLRRAKEISTQQQFDREGEFANEDPGVKRILTLLKLGRRTEEDIVSAPISTLEYWCQRDEAAVRSESIRTEAELDATDLTEKDLSEQECALYLRTRAEAAKVLQVKGQDFEEAERRSQLVAKEFRERQKRKERRQYQLDVKAFGPVNRDNAQKKSQDKGHEKVSDVDTRLAKRLRTSRSEKLCLEALEALEREQQELERGV